MENIRNFCIIAHIDHGKSTLADRMLEMTGTIRQATHGQMLDTMELEQERGITIKLTPARMKWKGYELNLIDTPGHADFQYEVSRSLVAVEGVVLLIDASQGIQAQTLSTLYMAVDLGLEIIPVLNKIDLPAADPVRVGAEITKMIGVEYDDIIKVSGKTGQNVDALLDTIIDKIPCPKSDLIFGDNINRALIFDSIYDSYRGVVVYVKILNGEFKSNGQCMLVHSHTQMSPTEVGFLTPRYNIDKTLKSGQIGYIVTGKKSVRDAKIGDTILGNVDFEDKSKIKNLTISGFSPSKPFVFSGIYPIDSSEYTKLKESLEKLSLNDSAIQFTNENSKALGFGFRCGFLGLLHMDIVKERLEREYDTNTIFTTPTVVYILKIKNTNFEVIKSGKNVKDLEESGLWKVVKMAETGKPLDESTKFDASDESTYKERIIIRSGADIPIGSGIEQFREPVAEVEIVGPVDFTGNIMALVQEYRGNLISMEYLDANRVVWKYNIPMGELIVDFNDKLKSATKGFATMNYEFKKYQKSDLVKLDILINGEIMESFSIVAHRDKAYYVGKRIVEKLKELIPKHMFVIPIQASVGTKVIARENISAIRKDVISKCYGGDITRKRKLLEKQKEGKKKLKSIGKVNVPSDIFIKMVSE